VQAALDSGAAFCFLNCLDTVFPLLHQSVGMMDIEDIARIAIPSSVAISLGMEIVLFSLLLGTFGLNARPYAAMVEEIELNCMREEVLASQ
jgi:hypothetical protein